MKKIKTLCVIIVAISIISIVFAGCGEEKKTATAAYNSEYMRITAEQNALEQTISESQDLINSKQQPYDESTVSSLETAISDAKAEIVSIPKCKGNAEEINKIVSDKLTKISYINANETLISAKNDLENSIKIMQQITNPNENFIVEKIKNIEGISGYASATEDTDVNGLLNKPGGYTSVTYFAYDKITDEDFSHKDTIVENGVEGGGGLEVFTTEEDAQKRNEYLASFDGTIFATGSHTVIGTIVIRTSDYLTASEQKELEKKIIDNLTQLH